MVAGVAASRTSWGKWVLLTLKILLSAALLAWALARVHPEQLWERMTSIAPAWLLLAGAAFILSNVLGAVQWARLLHMAGARLPFRTVHSFYWVGLFFSNLLPANVGGDVVRVVDVSRSTGSRRAAVGATLLDRLLGFVAIAVLALAAYPFVPSGTVSPVLLVVLGLFSLATLFLALTIYHRGLLGLLERRFGGVKFLDIGRRLTAVADELHRYRHHSGALARLLGLALVVQLLRIGVHILVARGMGISLSPLYYLVIVPILAVVVVIPVSVAGLGVRESAAVSLFGHVGLGASEAVAQQLATFFLCLAVNLVGGVLFIARSFRAPARSGAEEIS